MTRALPLLLLCALLPSGVFAQVSADYGGVNGGAVRVGASTTTCDAAAEGAIRYNTTSDALEFCNGTSWKSFVSSSSTGDSSTPPAGTGYFVVTNSAFDASLGGLSGANAQCLTDLTNNDWLNKSDATTRGLLDSSHVKAWLCMQTSTCNNAVAGATYTFAVSNQNTIGGATMTADGSGFIPGNTQNWSGTNYFGSDYEYWTGRAPGSSTLANAGGFADSSLNNCTSFTSNTNMQAGRVGTANNTDTSRWSFTAVSCNQTRRLICLVNP